MLVKVSELVIKFNSLSGDSGQQGRYKPCNHCLYIGIIIFPHIDSNNSMWSSDVIWCQQSQIGSGSEWLVVCEVLSHYPNQGCPMANRNPWEQTSVKFEREREIKFIGLFEDRGHRAPYKPFNHNLYIGIIISPHIDNPQSTGYN